MIAGVKDKDGLKQVVRLTDLSEYEKGSMTKREIVDRKAVSVSVHAFDRFGEIVEHVSPNDSLFFVLEGEAEVKISGKPYKVKSGEMIVFPANTPHAISDKSKFKMLQIELKE